MPNKLHVILNGFSLTEATDQAVGIVVRGNLFSAGNKLECGLAEDSISITVRSYKPSYIDKMEDSKHEQIANLYTYDLSVPHHEVCIEYTIGLPLRGNKSLLKLS